MSTISISRILRTVLPLGALMLGQSLLHEDVTVGTFNGGNCDPLMCNESGTSVGQSIDYEQVYASTAFTGPQSISALTWFFDSSVNSVGLAIGGTYEFEWGYAASNAVGNLSSNLASNYISGPNLIGTGVIPTGGISDNPSLTLSGFTPFTYDPSLGDLLLEIVVTNQDNIPNNGIDNGYNEADGSGTVTSRAECITNVGCLADGVGLVTEFSSTSAVPEPSSLVLLGTVAFAAGLRLRKALRKAN
jgi:hypothetical protein